MRLLRYSDPDFSAQLEMCATSSSLFDPVIEERTREIVSAVEERGDGALIEFTQRFDGATLTAEKIPVTTAELMNAAMVADEPLRIAVKEAHQNIAAFARRSLRRDWQMTNAQGAVVGEKFDPFHRVGIYIPGGTAPLVSTALMTITLAQVAGCGEIVVCTPAGRDGTVNPALLFAANFAGATEIYRLGGAQAVTAMALGTATLPRVQKIFGPGNAYVVAAKRLLFGHVSIDLLPGPSEVLVLADESADPALIAADLLAQAEHGSGHERIWLVTPVGRLLKAVERELARQLPLCSRRALIELNLQRNCWLIQVANLDSGVAVTNRLAPEHCQVMTRKARAVSEGITTAGAIFLGSDSPTVLGDYVAGPSHTLPTGGGGRSFAGMTVDQFQRRTSVVEYRRPALRKALKTVQKFAALEGLDAHGRSALIRLKR